MRKAVLVKASEIACIWEVTALNPRTSARCLVRAKSEKEAIAEGKLHPLLRRIRYPEYSAHIVEIQDAARNQRKRKLQAQRREA